MTDGPTVSPLEESDGAQTRKSSLAHFKPSRDRTAGSLEPEPRPPHDHWAVSEEAQGVLAALQQIPEQAREAWILRVLDAVDPIEASRSMDCSRTAMQRHLEVAEQSIAATIGSRAAAAVAALRAEADALDPEPFFLDIARRRRIHQHVRIAVLLAAGVLMVGVAVFVWIAVREGMFR